MRHFVSISFFYFHFSIFVFRFYKWIVYNASHNPYFRQASSFKRHKRIHTGEKSYQCDICNKQFAYKNVLVYLRRIQTGEILYQCYMCNKQFAPIGNLGRHRRIHIVEKPYHCNTCKNSLGRTVLLPIIGRYTLERSLFNEN